MKKYLVAAACLTLAAGAVYAANKEQKRFETVALSCEVINVPDVFPGAFEKAECVMIPSVLARFRCGCKLRTRRDGLPDGRALPWPMGSSSHTRWKAAASASKSAARRRT
jgi:hypothetical protein